MSILKQTILFTLILVKSTFVFSAVNSQGYSYPDGPILRVTPGEVCKNSAVKRYPEGIDYCERKVESQLKNEIFEEYDHDLGFNTKKLPRGDFKIDHFIPLCAGGANDKSNLWPQHKAIYAVTDPIEPIICLKMSEGKLLQKDAIELIKKAKLDLNQAPDVLSYVKSL